MNNDFSYDQDILELTLQLYHFENLNRKDVNDILLLFNNFITKSTIRNIQMKKKNSSAKTVDALSSDFDIILYENKNPFKKVDTEKKRFALYKANYGFEDPIEFTASLRDNVELSTQTAISAVHLSLTNQLRIFLQTPGLYNEILKYETKVEQKFEQTGIVSNFINGSLWRDYYQPSFEGQKVHPLFCFFDDFESSNALGSKNGLYLHISAHTSFTFKSKIKRYLPVNNILFGEKGI